MKKDEGGDWKPTLRPSQARGTDSIKPAYSTGIFVSSLGQMIQWAR